MDKKPLISVSILTVVLLVVGSLSNVVGYKSVTTTTLSDSPLFSIRTNSATTIENKKVITCDYLGKGVNALSFPLRDTNSERIQKFFERIRTMDDAAFINLIKLIIHTIEKEPTFHNVNTPEFLAVLYQLKNTQDMLLNKDIDLNNQAHATSDMSIPICDFLNGIFWFFAILYVYAGLFILTIFQFGSCYDSLWGTCLLMTK